MKQRIAGFLFDWLVGAYLAVMLHRIVWQELLLGVDSALSSAPSNSGAVIAGIPVWLVYGAVGLVLAIAASISKVSIALLVKGKLERTMWQRTAALHIASLLLSLTFITG